MKSLTTTIPYHTAIWLGIWFSVFAPVPAVANITAVLMSLNAVFLIIMIGFVLVWCDEKSIQKLFENYPRNAAVLGWLFRISAYSQAFVLIAVGGGWLVLGTAWFVAVTLVDLLRYRAQKLLTEQAA